MKYDAQVEIINPPNTLSAKVFMEGGGVVDHDVLERAEAVISDMAKGYLDWVKGDLVKITEAYKELKIQQDDPSEHLNSLFQIAHDMKGQGSVFNYDLMTILSSDLCRFIENKNSVNYKDLEVINLYIKTMQIVIAKRMNGAGGPEGEKLLSGITAVVRKIET